VDTVDQARAAVERLRPTLPRQVSLFYTQDQAPFARSQVTELQGNIVTALVLVMVLVVAAMGLRSAMIVGAGIPVSFLFALIFVWSFGYTFNFMVMFGMLLALGMLIDGAIVVTEYADRKMAEGQTPEDAFRAAAKRMFWPVTASVATTLAAFLPLVFWPGVSGEFMRYLPVTVFFVLTGSLLYALAFAPALGAKFGKPIRRDERTRKTLVLLEEGDPRQLRGFTGAYARLLGFTSAHAGITMLATVLVLVGTFVAYGQYGRGMSFFSDSDAAYARISVRARGNLSANEVYALVSEVEERILAIPGIKDANTQTMLGGGSGMGMSGSADTVGMIFLEMHEQNERELTGMEILERARQATADLAGIAVEVQKMEDGPPVGKPIQIQFTAYEQELLEPAVAAVRDYMDANVAGLRDVEDTRSLPGVEWRLAVDRAQAALYGVDVALVGIAVQLVTNGVMVGEYRPDNAADAVDIRVRFPATARGLSALDRLTIATAGGQVPISNFVRRAPAPNVGTIERIDGRMVKFIRADVAPGVLADDKVKEIQAWLDQADLDQRVEIRFRGANEEQADSIAFIIVALAMSLLLMFVLLVTQFNSFYQSALILAAVVMSTAGVLLGLLITNSPFSAVLTGVGVVALAGIVVNNNIVLIDTYNDIRRRHPELDHVSLIVRTGAQRLRPVLLTTVTTVFGLLPLASHLSIDFINRTVIYGGMVSGFWVPLAQAIVAGLTFATLLTLVATPALLALPHKPYIRAIGNAARQMAAARARLRLAWRPAAWAASPRPTCGGAVAGWATWARTRSTPCAW
jgi:multidrug efflux pump